MDRDGYEESGEVDIVEMDVPIATSGAKREKRVHRSLSLVLKEVSERPDENFTIADVRDALADRSFATLLFFFAAINMLPLPPGTSAILGLPPLLIAAQMVIGQTKLWLPDFILKRPISSERFRIVVEKMTPWLQKAERLVRPRWWPFPVMIADRLIGAIAFVLSILLVAPIPLGNWLPSCAMALYGLALSERDGLMFGAATGVALAAVAVIAAILMTATYAGQMFFHF
jgi:hypothetical protein